MNPTCRVYGTSPETRQHFLAECQPLQKPHDRFFKEIHSLTDVDICGTVSMCDVTQLILDPSLVFNSNIAIDKIELHSRGLISNLHKLRSRILPEKDSQQGLASSAIPASSGSCNETQNTSHRRFPNN